jgi:hypothetical protein
MEDVASGEAKRPTSDAETVFTRNILGEVLVFRPRRVAMRSVLRGSNA